MCWPYSCIKQSQMVLQVVCACFGSDLIPPSRRYPSRSWSSAGICNEQSFQLQQTALRQAHRLRRIPLTLDYLPPVKALISPETFKMASTASCMFCKIIKGESVVVLLEPGEGG
jgi:hypothetical protein